MKPRLTNPLDGNYVTGTLALLASGALLVCIVIFAPLFRTKEVLRAIRTGCRVTEPEILP